MYLGRSLFAAALGTMLSCTFCPGQNPTPVQFSTVNSSAVSPYTGMVAVDLNNDGLADLVQVTEAPPYNFSVSLSNGDGTFSAPQTTPLPSIQGTPHFTYGDFNGDGNADLVFEMNDTQLAVYLGNGNGTFQSPKLETISLPSGDILSGSLVAADYNHDGHQDLVATVDDAQSNEHLYVLAGDGQGNFSNAGDIFNARSGTYISSLVTGDFDADNNADVAVTTYAECNSSACNTILDVLYGNGAFGFTDWSPYSSDGSFSVGAGDVNGDGASDLFGIDSAANELLVLYGANPRGFSIDPIDLPPGTALQNLVMGDFNGDGRMDLAGVNEGDPTVGDYLTFVLSSSSIGNFTFQNYNLPGGGLYSNLVAGNFDRTTRPDLAVQQPGNAGGKGMLFAFMNQTTSGWYGGCSYPHSGVGFHLCNPGGGSSGSPVTFKASANSFGQIRKFELWVDGKKLSEQHNNWGGRGWFNLVTSLPAGTHRCTLNVTTIDNDAMDDNFTLSVP